MTLEGSCLCGGIRIVVREPFPGILRCHCSLCRKSSGAAGIATINVPADQFTWLAGEDMVATYERPSGYGNPFCRQCGCPAPERNRAGTWCRIPVGMLADSSKLAVTEHIHVGSKAHWDIIGDDAPQRDRD